MQKYYICNQWLLLRFQIHHLFQVSNINQAIPIGENLKQYILYLYSGQISCFFYKAESFSCSYIFLFIYTNHLKNTHSLRFVWINGGLIKDLIETKPIVELHTI